MHNLHPDFHQSVSRSAQSHQHRLLDLGTNCGWKGIASNDTTVRKILGSISNARCEQGTAGDAVRPTHQKSRVAGESSRFAARKENTTTTDMYRWLSNSNTEPHSRSARPKILFVTAKAHHGSSWIQYNKLMAPRALKSGWHLSLTPPWGQRHVTSFKRKA